MGGEIIQVQGLVKRFDGVTAVGGIDFAAQSGELFGLLGPNGAGKTASNGRYLIAKPARVSIRAKEDVRMSGTRID